MRVEAKRKSGDGNGDTPLLQPGPSEEPCRERSVCELKIARSCVVVRSATLASTRRFGGSGSDFPPPVQRQGASSSSRARPLFWLCQSPPLAVISCLWQQCVPFCAIDCREGESVFLCQLTNLFPPLHSSNTTWRRLGSKPRVLAASPRELAKESGLGAPPRLPLPHLVCLSLPLSRPSI
jgi:hypothetical protein